MYKMPVVTNFKKKDNTYCCVPLCNSRGSKNPDLSFHLFPSEKKNLDRRRKWILALRIGRPVSSRMSVCSRHFVHSDYTLPPHYEKKRPRLRHNAVPSLNLPAPEDCEGKPEKRPTTVMIKNELGSVQDDEENVDQEDLEIEVNIQSERDYFGTDDSIESERGYFGTDDNIESERDYLETDDTHSDRDCFETDDNSLSERECFETEGNIGSQRDDLGSEEYIDSGRNYLNVADYLEVESNIESEDEDFEAKNKIESMSLMTLSKKLI